MSRQRDEDAYHEYRYQEPRAQLAPTETAVPSRYHAVNAVDPAGLASSSSFSFDPSASFLQQSEGQSVELTDPYAGHNPTSWNYQAAGVSGNFTGPEQATAHSAQNSLPLGHQSFGPAEFGETPGSQSWNIASPGSQSWDSFARLHIEKSDNPLEIGPGIEPASSPIGGYQSDGFPVAGLSTAGSTGAASPVSSHGMPALAEGAHTRTSGKRSKKSGTGGDTPSSHSSHQGGRLRSAAQAARAPLHKPGETEQDRAARASHNLVERNYRTRLNAEYEKLLAAVPVPPDDKKISKHEVLELARERIQSLESECAAMKTENAELKEKIDELTTPYPSTSLN